eukprot:191361_1
MVIAIITKKNDNKNEIDKKNKKNKKNSQNDDDDIDNNDDDDMLEIEQVKFRGSMSSVENRHERVPSKPVIISITTPKGTRHVADAFGDYDGEHDAEKEELPEIDEDEEEEYNKQNEQHTN